MDTETAKARTERICKELLQTKGRRRNDVTEMQYAVCAVSSCVNVRWLIAWIAGKSRWDFWQVTRHWVRRYFLRQFHFVSACISLVDN